MLCEKCKTKVKMTTEFITEVIGKQAAFRVTGKNSKVKDASEMSDLPEDDSSASSSVNLWGITIKKVWSSYENAKDPLNVDAVKTEPKEKPCIVETDSLKRSDPLEAAGIKNEPEEDAGVLKIQTPSFLKDDSEEDYASSEDHNEDSDDSNYEEYKELHNQAKPRRTEALTFTCATCKESYPDFDTLTAHIKSKVNLDDLLCARLNIMNIYIFNICSPGMQQQFP